MSLLRRIRRFGAASPFVSKMRGKGRGTCTTSELVADAIKRGVGLLKGTDGRLYVLRGRS